MFAPVSYPDSVNHNERGKPQLQYSEEMLLLFWSGRAVSAHSFSYINNCKIQKIFGISQWVAKRHCFFVTTSVHQPHSNEGAQTFKTIDGSKQFFPDLCRVFDTTKCLAINNQGVILMKLLCSSQLNLSLGWEWTVISIDISHRLWG